MPFTRGINILAAVSASIGHVLPKPNRHRALADVVMAINNKRAIRIFTFVTSAGGLLKFLMSAVPTWRLSPIALEICNPISFDPRRSGFGDDHDPVGPDRRSVGVDYECKAHQIWIE